MGEGWGREREKERERERERERGRERETCQVNHITKMGLFARWVGRKLYLLFLYLYHDFGS